MTETGWPLIPRGTLPAPVPAVKNRPARPESARPEPVHADEDIRQLSIFGAETTEPAPADLAGLLAGPGRIGRMGGTARVSVRVDAAWRVHVLAAELVRRGLVVSWQTLEQDPRDVRDETLPVLSEAADAPDSTPRQSPSQSEIRAAHFDPDADPPPADFDPDADPIPLDPDVLDPDVLDPDVLEPDVLDPDVRGPDDEPRPDKGESPEKSCKPVFEVRTAYSSRLNGLAQAWPAAAAQLFLSGPRLRLWVAAAGEPAGGGYALGLDPAKDPRSIDAALVRAGLAGQVSDDGRRYVITGRRRLARLAELVGERPSAAPAEVWPGGAGA